MKKGKQVAISIFIIFNALAMLLSSNDALKDQTPVERFFFPYALWTRILQKWSLFTPDPRRGYNSYHVEITFRDHKKAYWQRPYPENWAFFQRHLAYNFQKWDLAGHNLDFPGPLWLDLAHYIQRLYWNDANPPIKIEFYSRTAHIPEPHETGYVQHDARELVWTDHLLFTYDVAQGRIL